MKKSKLFKRALAAVLTMTMALCTVPMTALTAEAPAETAPVKATYWLNEPQEESTQVRVGATMLNVPTEDLENGTVIAILKDTQGEYLAVDLNDQAALAEIDRNKLYFYDMDLQVYLARVSSTQCAVKLELNNTDNFDRLYGSVYVKEYTTSLTSLFYTTGNLMRCPTGSSSSNLYATLSAFNYSSNKEVNVGLRDATIYFKDGSTYGLPYGSGYLTPR